MGSVRLSGCRRCPPAASFAISTWVFSTGRTPPVRRSRPRPSGLPTGSIDGWLAGGDRLHVRAPRLRPHRRASSRCRAGPARQTDRGPRGPRPWPAARGSCSTTRGVASRARSLHPRSGDRSAARCTSRRTSHLRRPAEHRRARSSRAAPRGRGARSPAVVRRSRPSGGRGWQLGSVTSVPVWPSHPRASATLPS
jgi:hypothetical protein